MSALEKLKQLEPIQFRYKKEFDPDQKLRAGFSAQQVQKIIPEAVVEEDGILMLDMYVLRRFIKPGHNQDVYNFLQRMKMVRDKYNYTGITGVFKVLSGGNTSEFVICQGFNEFGKLGEFEETDKSLQELYNEMFGEGSYRKDATAYNQALEMWGRSTERLMQMEDLSTQLN